MSSTRQRWVIVLSPDNALFARYVVSTWTTVVTLTAATEFARKSDADNVLRRFYARFPHALVKEIV